MLNEKPILITGMPRSGTTWVGRTIAVAPALRYIHEPFNITQGRCVCGVHFDKWFYYLNPENAASFHPHLKHLLSSSTNRFQLLNTLANVLRNKSLHPMKAFVKHLKAQRTVVKDPLAACSAAWMASAFNMKVVIIVRHPAAVVSSFKKLDWGHPFAHFLAQPLLMRDYLTPFTDEITAFASGEYDAVDQAALLWKLIYYLLQKQSAQYNDWLIIRYEDLASDVEAGFTTMFQSLGLMFTTQVQQAIQERSSRENQIAADDPYSLLRYSQKMVWRWKSLLSDEEIKRVRMRTAEVAQLYYSDEDW